MKKSVALLVGLTALVSVAVTLGFYALFGSGTAAWPPAIQATFTLALLGATGYYAFETHRLVEQADPYDTIRARTREEATSELLELLGDNRPVLESLARRFPVDWLVLTLTGPVPGIPPHETDAVSDLATTLQARSHPLHTHAAVAVYAFAQTLQLAVGQVGLLREVIGTEHRRAMRAQEQWTASGAESAYGPLRDRLQATWTWEDMVNGSVVQQALRDYKTLVEYLGEYFHSGMKKEPPEPPRVLLGLPDPVT